MSGENGRRDEGGEKENENKSEESFLDADRSESFDTARGEKSVGEEAKAKKSRDTTANGESEEPV